jgi:YidC/Oxa1 family membrane protein insertase
MPVTLDAQKSISYEFDIYLGPKESRYLQDFGEERHLDAMIDYGWMEVLAKPMAWILDKFHDLTGNWGIAIILLTIIVRMLLWPVAQKSSTSMMRMSKLAPLMQELQEKYKDDPQTLMQKQAELYKKFNINPFGCLPLLLQMPIFFALYRCIFVTGGLYHAEFFGWIHDLSAKDPYFVLPLISVGLIVFQQLITPTATKNKQQKYMMMFMPVMIGAMMLWLPAGLCLYMVISSMIGMVQSLYTRKILAAEEGDLANAVTEGLGANAGRVIEVERTESKDKRVRKRRQRVKDRGTKDGEQAEDGDEAEGDEK